MPQYAKAVAADSGGGGTGGPRFGAESLVSGKRQYNEGARAHEYRQWDPLKCQSTHDRSTFENMGQHMEGALRQTRFHRGFQRRRARPVPPLRARARVWRARACVRVRHAG